MDVDTLIREIDARMEDDYSRLRRRRYVHRTTGVIYNIVLIGAPAILAVGLTDSETIGGKSLLLCIAIVGGLNASFRPYLNSQRRRADLNNMRQLRDRFRIDILRASGDEKEQVEIFEKYSELYAEIYNKRGKMTVEASSSGSPEIEISSD